MLGALKFMEKYMEKFNPHNLKYKRVEDLPEERRKEYANISEDEGGGFVRAEALKAYEWWQEKAAEVNRKEEERKIADEEEYRKKSWLGQFFHQIYLPDKATFLDFAREEADEDFTKERAYRENKDISSLKKFLINGFSNIFNRGSNYFMEGAFDRKLPRGFLGLVNQGLIHSVVSEDRSGRLPAEVMQKFINKIYKMHGRNEIELLPMKLSRADAKDEAHVRSLIREFTEIAKNGRLGSFVYVTEYVQHGITIETGLDVLSQSARNAELSDDFGAVLVTLGGHIPGVHNLVLEGGMGEHSGIYEYVEKGTVGGGMHAKDRVIEEVSDALVVEYEKRWGDANEKLATTRRE